MRSIIVCGVLVVSLAFTSCVPSIQPFFEEKDVYFDRSLVGTWSERDGKEKWKITARDESSYFIDQTDEQGRPLRFEARLFKIGTDSFIDVLPVPSSKIAGDLYLDHVLPAHTLLTVKIERCSVNLSFLDPTWVKGFLMTSPGAVAHTNRNGEVVLTDSTAAMQAFIKKHLSTPGAFEATETLFKKGDTQCVQ